MLRQWYSGLSLRAKAMGLTVAITTLSLTVVAGASIMQIRSQISDGQHRAAESVALGVARASELAFAVRDSKELTRLAESFLRDDSILFIAVYADGTEPLAFATRDLESFQQYSRVGNDDRRCVIGERPIEVSVQDEFSTDTETGGTIKAAPHHGRLTGRVIVGLSTAPAMLAQQRQSEVTAGVSIAAAALGAAVLFITLGGWMRRLQKLTRASQAISRGDFSGSVADPHEDEIGRLADSFDSMRLALRQRDVKLRDFTDTLQVQVKQRTKDLELALATAEGANRAKSLFLANMSHELRTPLNGVIGMVDLLLATEPNVQQRRYCEVAKSSARSLLELINDILDFSKIEAGKLELDMTEFDLHELVEGVARMFVDRADKKRLEMACSLARDVPRTVAGDPVRLRQVLLNLVSNAIKFTEQGEVVVSALIQEQTETHTLVRFEVRDSGVGIPADRLDRLFRSFSQVDASTTRKFGGTGLGLAICQRLAELFGGQIGVHSTEGKGSTFWFTARLERRTQVQPTTRENLVDLRGKRVLAVDDNSTNREILQAQLSSWRLRADIAEGAQQAMAMLRSAVDSGEPYDFAILDMHMPKTDGMQLASDIKADPITKDVILISLSSISDQMKPGQISQIGFAACLTKPALPSELYNAIIDSLSAHERPGTVHALRGASALLEESSIKGLRILLAEDNEVNRLVASELLGQAGCHCTMVVNGREAVEEALRNEYDAILMDCQMPELDGFAATQAIRKAEATSEPPQHRCIIALTANAIKGDREECLAAGMDGYVTKPIDPPQLFSTIRSLLPAERCAQAALEIPSVREPEPALQPPVTLVAKQPLPVDLESLQKRCMGSRRIAAKALNKFDTIAAQDVQALCDGVQRGDAKAVAASAHKIKGAAANVSADAVRQIAGEIEHLASDDGLSQSQEFIDRLQNEMNRFRAYLSTALAELNVSGESTSAQSERAIGNKK